MGRGRARATLERCSAVLELLRRRGCASADAVALALGITRTQAYRALSLLAEQGAVWRYRLASCFVAWCPAGSRPGAILIACGGRVARLDVGGLARAAASLIERGARALRPVRLAPCRGGAVLAAVTAILRLALDGAAEEWRRRKRGAVFLIADPRPALERLKRVVESGALPLGPDPP